MKLYNADSVDSGNAVFAYTDMEYPYGTFWVEGKSGSNCAVVTNTGTALFAKTFVSCVAANIFVPPPKNYFHCEYMSKF
jgi:hypothetical protein